MNEIIEELTSFPMNHFIGVSIVNPEYFEGCISHLTGQERSEIVAFNDALKTLLANQAKSYIDALKLALQHNDLLSLETFLNKNSDIAKFLEKNIAKLKPAALSFALK